MKNKAIQEDLKHIESTVDLMETKGKLHTYYLDKTTKGKFIVSKDETPEFIFDYEDEAREYINGCINGKVADPMLENAVAMQFPIDAIESTPKGSGPDFIKEFKDTLTKSSGPKHKESPLCYDKGHEELLICATKLSNKMEQVRIRQGYPELYADWYELKQAINKYKD